MRQKSTLNQEERERWWGRGKCLKISGAFLSMQGERIYMIYPQRLTFFLIVVYSKSVIKGYHRRPKKSKNLKHLENLR